VRSSSVRSCVTLWGGDPSSWSTFGFLSWHMVRAKTTALLSDVFCVAKQRRESDERLAINRPTSRERITSGQRRNVGLKVGLPIEKENGMVVWYSRV